MSAQDAQYAVWARLVAELKPSPPSCKAKCARASDSTAGFGVTRRAWRLQPHHAPWRKLPELVVGPGAGTEQQEEPGGLDILKGWYPPLACASSSPSFGGPDWLAY